MGARVRYCLLKQSWEACGATWGTGFSAASDPHLPLLLMGVTCRMAPVRIRALFGKHRSSASIRCGTIGWRGQWMSWDSEEE